MNVSTGVAIGMIVLFSLVGLGIFMQLVGVGSARRVKPIDLLSFLERILFRFRK